MTIDYLRRWLIKAENDLKVAEHEIAIEKGECVTEAICFHCQQAVEKYLKAFLVSQNVDFGKTHNIEYLITLCSSHDQEFKNLRVGNLSYYAVEVRYPDDFYTPTLQEAEECIDFAKEVKRFVYNRIAPEAVSSRNHNPQPPANQSLSRT